MCMCMCIVHVHCACACALCMCIVHVHCACALCMCDCMGTAEAHGGQGGAGVRRGAQGSCLARARPPLLPCQLLRCSYWHSTGYYLLTCFAHRRLFDHAAQSGHRLQLGRYRRGIRRGAGLLPLVLSVTMSESRRHQTLRGAGKCPHKRCPLSIALACVRLDEKTFFAVSGANVSRSFTMFCPERLCFPRVFRVFVCVGISISVGHGSA